MDFAFSFIIQNGGIDTEEDYKYEVRSLLNIKLVMCCIEVGIEFLSRLRGGIMP